MPSLKTLFRLQLVWAAMGLGYNSVSAWRLAQDQSALAPTDPAAGAIFMTLCGAVILAGLACRAAIYKFVMPALTAALAYSGVFLHARVLAAASGTQGGVESAVTTYGYASISALLIALAINIYGLAVLTAGITAVWCPRTQ